MTAKLMLFFSNVTDKPELFGFCSKQNQNLFEFENKIKMFPLPLDLDKVHITVPSCSI